MAACVIARSLNVFGTQLLKKNIAGASRAYSDLCKCGKKQSPIDICTQNVQSIEKDKLKFQKHWDDNVKLCMKLDGDILQIKVNSDCPVTVEGGPLCGKYKLDVVNMKWGECDTNGTEHAIDGQRLAMEAQLVYMNEKFGCFAEALKEQDGVAMLAVFLRSSQNKNCDLDVIVNQIPALNKSKGQEPVPLSKNILPMFKGILESSPYFTYQGSLPVPPCCETVRWLVWKNAVCVHKDQICAFRTICGCNGKIVKNIRDLQELNGRCVQCVKEKKC